MTAISRNESIAEEVHGDRENESVSCLFSSEIPQRAERMQAGLSAALHHLIVALLVGGDEDDLGAEAVPRLLEELERVGTAAALPRIPEDHAAGLNVSVDEAADSWAEGLFLIGPDPNEEPALRERELEVCLFPFERALISGCTRTSPCSGCR